jgi:hypothetical protein
MAASDDTADSGPFGPLSSSRTALLTTYRRGGEAVATPLSIAVANGRAYFVTAGDSGKAQRLAHTDRVILAPCTVGGKVTGEAVEGRARRPRPRRAPHGRQGPAAAHRGTVLEPGRLPAVPRQEDGAVRGRPGYEHTMTSRVRGPWTPSTRSSSMSLVALGPLIQVWGREGSRRATPWGTVPTTWAAVTTTRW